MLRAPPLLANARQPLAPGMAWAHFMPSVNFSLGYANDQLIQICCPDIRAIGMTSRELRRSKERQATLKAHQAKVESKGFA